MFVCKNREAHPHWLLVRLLRRCPGRVRAEEMTEALDRRLTAAHLAAEADCLRAHPSFERLYGWAWLLALTAECRALGPAGSRWADALEPAATAVVTLLCDWLRRATCPVRHGVHTTSAFALGLILDSDFTGDHRLATFAVLALDGDPRDG